VDGTLNERGSVRYTTIQCIHIKTIEHQFHKESVELYVTTLGDHDIILGTDWLHAHNPEVDWAVPQIMFTQCPKTCSLTKQPLVITSRKMQTHATTIKNAAPLPLIPELIDKLCGTRYFTKWIFVGDTTISISKKEMNIKLPSRPP
jgi:hypothetical protein